jgi:hypothetical protein
MVCHALFVLADHGTPPEDYAAGRPAGEQPLPGREEPRRRRCGSVEVSELGAFHGEPVPRGGAAAEDGEQGATGPVAREAAGGGRPGHAVGEGDHAQGDGPAPGLTAVAPEDVARVLGRHILDRREGDPVY